MKTIYALLACLVLSIQFVDAQYAPASPAISQALVAAEVPNDPQAPVHFRNPRATFERALNTMASGDYADHFLCFTEEGLEALLDGKEFTPQELQAIKQEIVAEGFTDLKIDAFSHATVAGKIEITTEISSVKNSVRYKETGKVVLVDTGSGWKIELFDLAPDGVQQIP